MDGGPEGRRRVPPPFRFPVVAWPLCVFLWAFIGAAIWAWS